MVLNDRMSDRRVSYRETIRCKNSRANSVRRSLRDYPYGDYAVNKYSGGLRRIIPTRLLRLFLPAILIIHCDLAISAKPV